MTFLNISKDIGLLAVIENSKEAKTLLNSSALSHQSENILLSRLVIKDASNRGTIMHN